MRFVFLMRAWLYVLVLVGTATFASCGGASSGGPDGGPGTAGSGSGGGGGLTSGVGGGVTAGAGGAAGAAAVGGGGGSLQPCDGVDYFIQQGWCAATYEAQTARDLANFCQSVDVFTGNCGNGFRVWRTQIRLALADPVTCIYDAAGLFAAQI
jgi:hypothetical protein